MAKKVCFFSTVFSITETLFVLFLLPVLARTLKETRPAYLSTPSFGKDGAACYGNYLRKAWLAKRGILFLEQ